ncbi:MAG: phage portal protein [Planctomycetota bacterium]|jgi:HK97 family phage portal protein
MGIGDGDSGRDLTNDDHGWAAAYAASPTMFRCIDVRSKTLATIALRVVDGAGNEVSDHPFGSVIDPRNTLLRYTTENDLQVFGRAFWEFGRDRNQPGKAWIKRLNPATVEVVSDPKHGVVGYVQRLGGQVVAKWSRDELVYFASYNPANDTGFVSPTQRALRSIGVTLSITEYGAFFFSNGAIPDGILTSDVKLMNTDRERILENWRRQFQGTDNAHGTALLDGPPGARVQFQTISQPIKDLAMPELSESQQREIAKSYGVPPTIAMIENAANYATADSERKSLYTETVLPELDLMLDTINTQLVPKFGLPVQIEAVTDDIDALQEDLTEITQRASQGVGAGYLSLNDARDRESEDPLATDYFIVAGKLIPRALLESGDFEQLRDLGVLGQPEPAPQLGGFPFASLPPGQEKQEPPIVIDNPPQKAVVDIHVHAPDMDSAQQMTKTVMADTMHKDLERWRRKIANKGVHTSFAPDYLPDAVAAFLRAEVRGWDGETDVEQWIDAAFERAVSAVDALAVKQADDETATPEEFEAFWRGIDGLFDQLGEVFEVQFDELRQRLIDGLRQASLQETEFDVQSFLAESAPLMVEALAGTEDDPGVLVNIVQAGAARGNDLLHTASKQAELTIDWQIINEFALRFAREFAGRLVTGINDTTLDVLRTKIGEWIEAGGSLEDLADFIEGTLPELDVPEGWSPGKLQWATSRSRARLIAQTETTRAFTEGNFERWRQLGVTEAQWRTQRDSDVDDEICRPLHGVIGNIVEGWVNPKDGRTYRIPAHPGCRCFPRPITGRV